MSKDGAKPCVLLIDPKDSTRIQIADYLEGQGYDVIQEVSQREAAKYLGSRTARLPDVIMLEYYPPSNQRNGKPLAGEFSGLDFLKRNLQRNIPVLAIPGSSGKVQEMLDAGANWGCDKFVLHSAINNTDEAFLAPLKTHLEQAILLQRPR